MITELSIAVRPDDENDPSKIIQAISQKLAETHINEKPGTIQYTVLKKSIDARHRQIKIVLKLKVFINEAVSSNPTPAFTPEWKNAGGKKSVIIVGSGPAGLFAALKLLEHGVKPVIIERGKITSERKTDIAAISTKNIVDENSNYCFGEGGAGTFSDGKLYTRSNKRGNISRILQIFTFFGADEKILTDAHPHIGTDKLPAVINAMRKKIISLGGKFHFSTKCTDFILTSPPSQKPAVTGIKAVDVLTGTERTFTADAVLLATGHSATDIYSLLAKKCPAALEAKTFAAGVRVEHPRKTIDALQYHGQDTQNLPAAEYRLTAQVRERGVYSFCMCPGGFVVPAGSGPDEIVVNGMSAAKRNSAWSNAAIVVEIRPEDIPAQFASQAESSGCKAMAGLYFRTYLEQLTKQHGNGQSAPAQRLTDFLSHTDSATLPKSSYTPKLVPSRIDTWMPEHIEKRLEEGFAHFEKSKKGFVTDDAVIIASETRTSTPVRILRNAENFECTEIKKLYPAGEGSGYSGGIVSSAMDGENAAEHILRAVE